MNEFSPWDLRLLDPAFDPGDTGEYGLALVLAGDQIECATLDLKRNRFLGLHRITRRDTEPVAADTFPRTDFSDFLARVGNELPWLRNPFRMVRIACTEGHSTLVPDMLFDPEDKDRYARFNFKVGEGDAILQAHLMPVDAWQVFTVPGEIARTCRDTFPQARIVHSSGLFAESVWVNYRGRIDHTQLFLNLRKHLLELMVFDGRRLEYLNTFSHQAPEDVAYYLIFVMEQLGLNPETVPLILLGDTSPDTGLTVLLKKYIRHIGYGRRNEAYGYSHLFDRVPSHGFFPLLNFFSCGL